MEAETASIAPALHFAPPLVFDNPQGWGPTEDSIPSKLKEIPFAPFSKSDKLGKAADNLGYQGRGYRGQTQSYGSADTAFNYYHQETDEGGDFQLVSAAVKQKSKAKPRWQQGWQKKPQARRRGETVTQNKPNFAPQASRSALAEVGRRSRRREGRRFGEKLSREASIEVKPDWVVVDQFDLNQMLKMRSKEQVGQPEDLLQAGSVEFYDKVYDRITTKNKKPLQRIDRNFFRVTTSDDPIISRLHADDVASDANVFATDAILSVLMTAPRSNYSWDVVVRRVNPPNREEDGVLVDNNPKIYFDKRDNSLFDYLTVNENASEPPRDDDPNVINTPLKLSDEATFINQNFSQQVLARDGNRHRMAQPSPFQGTLTDEEMASVGYRYRKFDLGDGNVLLARCQVDAALKKDNGVEFVNVKALNEYDSKATGIDWRQKLDSQRGAVMATEFKNNASKLARWTAQSVLAGVQHLKLGFVTRTAAKDASNHQIVGMVTYNPVDFAGQIGLGAANMWGILKHIIDKCQELDEGTYVLVKDPSKPLLRIYSVPEGSLADAGDDEGHPGYSVIDGSDDEDDEQD
ncbi:Eukaryotic translation initiation factor 3 subunit 7 (eIF3) [Acanthamoeba castellanii str. Neff]|uniref:Eukaryotic translation initiation factor 3 subunit D n=1 Tax=Acanthamoeba castellanii (strain ATCC 30010 / Neff) TaxID=1257118 RepID=L8HC00_ACACF|nr:Eukaryotic translation initiation factor 3 subunit 7 (eIF3) [Acanthamoeba castellanii str. Neff]ELR23054.1 Eukaryotic translation initiation factor 3 subunit 7 (eIF3) [Acanthamoeba castellanii str. Neff]